MLIYGDIRDDIIWFETMSVYVTIIIVAALWSLKILSRDHFITKFWSNFSIHFDWNNSSGYETIFLINNFYLPLNKIEIICIVLISWQ